MVHGRINILAAYSVRDKDGTELASQFS
jgi:hypothetical protein